MSLDLEEPRPVDDVHDDHAVSHITPFSESQAASSSDRLRHSREDLQDAVSIPPRSGPPSSTGRSKASQAGSFRQPRYIVHTDVEDAIPEDGDQDLIELPPTYSERRGTATVIRGGIFALYRLPITSTITTSDSIPVTVSQVTPILFFSFCSCCGVKRCPFGLPGRASLGGRWVYGFREVPCSVRTLVLFVRFQIPPLLLFSFWSCGMKCWC
jgi:hypothetical protein